VSSSAAPPAGILARLENDRREIDAALRRALAVHLGDAADSITAPVRYALDAGGKRLRPLLCVAAFRATAGADGGPALFEMACALEVVHCYSLVHDDLPCMDDDDLRRGRPTAHRVFGLAAATLAGAAMIPLAFQILVTGAASLGLDAARRRDLVAVLAAAAGAGGMVGGQVADLAAESRPVGLDELETIHRGKTGALFDAALRLGGISGRAAPETVAALGRAGSQIGVAFQVTDDVLDETGDVARTGKTAGRDRAREKATALAIMGVAGARERAAAAAERAAQALRSAGLNDPDLLALVRFAVERDR
jgi:geranylgeranyl pyrophosphate synthase